MNKENREEHELEWEWLVDQRDGYKADFSLDTYDKLEVIGNIYENPELLKEK